MKRLAPVVCVGALLPGSAWAQTIDLPSVPVGSELRITVSLTSFGVAPLPDIPVDLTIPGGCGTFHGVSSVTVTTDASGMFSFVFTPKDMPGVCTIVGQNGIYSGMVRTTIYRPSEVVLNVNDVLSTMPPPLTSASFSGTVTARGLPIWGLPFSVEGPFAPGPATGTIENGGAGGTTGATGGWGFTVRGNGVPGVYDFVVHAGTQQRRLRLWQQEATSTDFVPGRQVRVRDPLAHIHGPTVLSLVSAPAGCRIAMADRGPGLPIPSMPTIGEFPQGVVQMTIDGCPDGSAITLRTDYASNFPANAVVYGNAGGTPPWQLLPGTVSASSAVYTVVDGGLGDRAGTDHSISNVVGVALPATAPSPAPPRVEDLWWAGSAENGWGMSVAQTADGSNLFAGIYAYDASGDPTWWVMPGGLWNYGRTAFESSLVSPFGTPWYDFDTALNIYGTPGEVKLSFDGADSIALEYVIGQTSGRKALLRQPFGGDDASPVPAVGGMWWGGPTQSGWGVAITQHHATLFCVWYTYDASNKPTWFVMPGGRWTSGSTYEGRIYRTHGSPWLGQAYDASKLTVTDVGPYRLRFDGSGAMLDYTVEGRTGSLALTRQAPF